MTGVPLDFSIIIATRNRPLALVRCLDSLTRLAYPKDRYEVIVVDDGSDLPLEAAVDPVRDRLQLSVLRTRQAGPGIARNAGAARARGRFLAFTDDDCIVEADWLGALKAHFDRSPGDLVGGRMINGLPGNPYSATCHVIFDAVYNFYDPAKGRAHFFPSCNLAMAASGFHAIGGFIADWTLVAAEDRAFGYRWLRYGGTLARAPAAVIYHYHAHTLTSFCELHLRYGRGAFRYHALRATQNEAGGLRLDWAFFRECLRCTFAQHSLSRACAIAGLLGVWRVANAIGYFSERKRAGSRRPRLPSAPAGGAQSTRSKAECSAL